MMRRIFADLFKGEDIKKQAKENDEILRGARAMNNQLSYGFLERHTEDYDLFSKHPKKAAHQLENRLDEMSGGDNYYVKPAKHKGTFKVMDRGNNLESDHDDYGIVDFTMQPKKVKTVNIMGIKNVHQSVRIADAKRELKNPEKSFRRAKDEGDLLRIKQSKQLRRRWF